ncbi:hypothetical protein PC117_g9413 [Phytophthora cactorum]|uniref:Eukaryotic/viral aspartic protease n=1 Tax=Phytophthora cactorum TaxID=29920 RepID=A0A8T1DUY5_9STRA|nr:hypothetical protein PC117_g9413 [Phytophthora cactorum]
MQSSVWIRQFNPRQTRQATWGDLRDELAYPYNSLSTTQEDTVSLLRAMGMDVRSYPSNLTLKKWSPSEAGSHLHKWKKKLRAAFGVKDISKGRQPVSRVAVQTANPAMVPQPETPAKVDEGCRDFSDNVFSKGEESPYFQGSHMVTPRSASRARRLADDCDGSHAGRSAPMSSRGTRGRRSSNRHDDNSSDSNYDVWDQVDESPREELVRQMDALCATNTSDSDPRLELALHTPLDRIKLKSDNSMQWLKTFAFKMKGTWTRPDEWCAAFEQSLRDAFINYYCTQYKQSPAARYYAATRERKEHICDYLNRLNGGKNDSSPEALLNRSGPKGTPTVAATLEAEEKAGRNKTARTVATGWTPTVGIVAPTAVASDASKTDSARILDVYRG